MIVPTLFLLPAVLYGATWFASWRAAPSSGGDRGRWILALAIALHGASLAVPWDDNGFHWGFAKALSATLWIGLVLLWIEGRRVSLEAIRIAVLPVAAVMMMLPLAWPGRHFPIDERTPLFVPHLLSGTLAYGVLLLAALHALLMLWVQRDLQRPLGEAERGPMARWVGRLPPLMVLERVLFRFIGIGFVLLLLTTASGMLFSEQVFGRPFRLEHKTVFSVVSLLFFGVLLAGRAAKGWRGRIATRFTLGGFAVLMLAYVGTRFVLEVLLGRY